MESNIYLRQVFVFVFAESGSCGKKSIRLRVIDEF